MIYFFIKGLIFGSYLAAVPGPIGMTCIQRTLKHGRPSGIASALGAVTAESFYACIIIYGLTFVSQQFCREQFCINDANFLFFWKSCLQLLGSLFLFYIGYHTIFAAPDKNVNLGKKHDLFSDYISITFLTIATPMVLINFIIIFSGFGLNDLNINFYSATIMLAGFIIGSSAYYISLVGVVSALKTKFDTHLIKIMNRVFGSMIIIFAVFMFLKGLAIF